MTREWSAARSPWQQADDRKLVQYRLSWSKTGWNHLRNRCKHPIYCSRKQSTPSEKHGAGRIHPSCDQRVVSEPKFPGSVLPSPLQYCASQLRSQKSCIDTAYLWQDTSSTWWPRTDSWTPIRLPPEFQRPEQIPRHDARPVCRTNRTIQHLQVGRTWNSRSWGWARPLPRIQLEF